MKTPQLQQLSRRERQIMDLIFEHGELSAKEVMEHMEDAPSYATVRSILRILEEKGFVNHRKSSRLFLYKAAISPEKQRHTSMKKLLQTFFGGSISEAVATFINHPESQLSQNELAELEAIIQAAKDRDQE